MLVFIVGAGAYLALEAHDSENDRDAIIDKGPLTDEDDTPNNEAPPTETPLVNETPPSRNQPPESDDDFIVQKEIIWGDRSKKQVIFTFDGGSGDHSATEILETLGEHSVKGTFFLTGKWVEQNPEIARRIVQEGHEIFNHTYNHPDLTTLSLEDINWEFAKTEEIIKNITGVTTKPYFRPPYGARNSVVLDVAGKAGYRSIYWTVDALDWKPEYTEDMTRDRIMNNLANGTIYMMHIGDDITGAILDDVFTKIKAKGYSIVSLTQGL